MSQGSDDDDPFNVRGMLSMCNQPRATLPILARTDSDSEADDPVGLSRFLRRRVDSLAADTPHDTGTVARMDAPDSATQPHPLVPAVGDIARSSAYTMSELVEMGVPGAAEMAVRRGPVEHAQMPLASHQRILAFRVDCATRAAAKSAAEAQRRGRGAAVRSSPDILPLTRQPVSDGLRYGIEAFAPQLAVAADDPYVVLQLPLLAESFMAASAHALRTVDGLVRSRPYLAYKVGITRSPSHRFHRRDYGYYILGYTRMVVVFRGAPRLAAELERRLIAEFRGNTGCQNVATGGENPPPVGIGCFVYLVCADLADGRSLEQLGAENRALAGNDRALALLTRAEAVPIPDMLARDRRAPTE